MVCEVEEAGGDTGGGEGLSGGVEGFGACWVGGGMEEGGDVYCWEGGGIFERTHCGEGEKGLRDYGVSESGDLVYAMVSSLV